MATNRTIAAVLEQLVAQTRQIWGEEDAVQQSPGLQQTAEQIVTIDAYPLPPDLEPRFF
jgi:hypothetical protein